MRDTALIPDSEAVSLDVVSPEVLAHWRAFSQNPIMTKREEKIAFISLIVGTLTCVAAILVVPEVRTKLGLDSSTTPSNPPPAATGRTSIGGADGKGGPPPVPPGGGEGGSYYIGGTGYGGTGGEVGADFPPGPPPVPPGGGEGESYYIGGISYGGTSTGGEVGTNFPPVPASPVEVPSTVSGLLWKTEGKIDGKTAFYEFLPDGTVQIRAGLVGTPFVPVNMSWYQTGQKIHVLTYDDGSKKHVAWDYEGVVYEQAIQGTSQDGAGAASPFMWTKVDL